jgi:competence protein ComEA
VSPSASPAHRGVVEVTVVASLVLAIAAVAIVRIAQQPGPDLPHALRVTPERWLIDLSSAPVAELALLPEVGPQLAARIVADRALHGPFATIDELARVHGFGPAKLEAIRGFAVADRSRMPSHGAAPR